MRPLYSECYLPWFLLVWGIQPNAILISQVLVLLSSLLWSQGFMCLLENFEYHCTYASSRNRSKPSVTWSGIFVEHGGYPLNNCKSNIEGELLLYGWLHVECIVSLELILIFCLTSPWSYQRHCSWLYFHQWPFLSMLSKKPSLSSRLRLICSAELCRVNY